MRLCEDTCITEEEWKVWKQSLYISIYAPPKQGLVKKEKKLQNARCTVITFVEI